MSEMRLCKPAVTLINWVLNPFDANVQVQGPDGRPASQLVAVQRGLTVGITPYLGNNQLATETYFYGEATAITEADVLTAAGVGVAAAWAAALDSMSNIFPMLADPAPEDAGKGLPYYLRLDAWRAQINYTPGQMSSISAYLGVYKTETYTSKPVGMMELVFLDADGRAARQQNIDQHNQNLAYYDAILNGTQPGFTDQPQEEQDRQQAQATVARKAAQEAVAQLEAQLVGSMEALLTAPGVPESVGALVQGVFLANKANLPQWADVDIAALMTDFQAAITDLLS